MKKRNDVEKRVNFLQMLEAMEGVPAGCYAELEGLTMDLVEFSGQLGTAFSWNGEENTYCFEVSSENRYAQMRVVVGESKRSVVYCDAARKESNVDFHLEMMDFEADNTSFSLSSKRSMLGVAKPYGDRIDAYYEDTRLQKTETGFLSKTKVGHTYPVLNMKGNSSLNAIADMLPSLVAWGYPNDKFINIHALRMIDGQLILREIQDKGASNVYRMAGSGSTGATGRQPKIK